MAPITPYESAKLRFIAFISAQDENYPNSIHNPQTMLSIIHQINKYQLRDAPYEVLRDSIGKPYLILKRKSPKDKIIKVLPIEDMFPILYELHLKYNHKSLDLRPYLEDYLIPDEYLYYLALSCFECWKKFDVKPEEESVNVGLVYVVPGYKTNSETVVNFQYILIYIHEQTEFTILRPLEQKDAFEIAIELMKIVTQFGLPQKICLHGNSDLLNEHVTKNFKDLCPKFDIIFESKGVDYFVPANIVSRLVKMCNKDKDTSWVLQLPVLQKNINKTVKYDKHDRRDTASKKSPFQKLLTDMIKDNYGIVEPDVFDIDDDDDDANEPILETMSPKASPETILPDYIPNSECVNIADDMFEIEENTLTDDSSQDSKEALKGIVKKEWSQTLSKSIENTTSTETYEKLTEDKHIKKQQDNSSVYFIDTISLDTEDDEVMPTIQFTEQQIGKIEEIMSNITIDGGNEEMLETIKVKPEPTIETVETVDNFSVINNVRIDEIQTKDEPMDHNIETADNIPTSEINMEQNDHPVVKEESVPTITETLYRETILKQEEHRQTNQTTSKTNEEEINETEETQEQDTLIHQLKEDKTENEKIYQKIVDEADTKQNLPEDLDKVNDDLNNEGVQENFVETDWEAVLDAEIIEKPTK